MLDGESPTNNGDTESMQIIELTREGIRIEVEVHKHSGCGLLESAYEICPSYLLRMRRVRYERQKPIPVIIRK
ncbi:MAG: GxxExxY protein [Bacteroidota bacterium]|jgi:GxxExxY protein